MYVNVTIRGVGVTAVAVEKQSSITYCQWVHVALAIRHAPHCYLWHVQAIFFHIIS
jgi:hypothetical protein